MIHFRKLSLWLFLLSAPGMLRSSQVTSSQNPPPVPPKNKNYRPSITIQTQNIRLPEPSEPSVSVPFRINVTSPSGTTKPESTTVLHDSERERKLLLLMQAIWHNDVPTVKSIIEDYGINVTQVVPIFDDSPLSLAKKRNETELVNYMESLVEKRNEEELVNYMRQHQKESDNAAYELQMPSSKDGVVMPTDLPARERKATHFVVKHRKTQSMQVPATVATNNTKPTSLIINPTTPRITPSDAILRVNKPRPKKFVEIELMKAIESNNLDKALPYIVLADAEQQKLIDLNAPIHSDDNQQQPAQSPLYRATELGHRALVKTMLQHNGQPLYYNEATQDSPLERAIEKGASHVEIAADMIASLPETKLNHKNRQGLTLLMFALEHNNKPIAELLLKRGASATLGDNHGITPLMVTAMSCNKDLLHLLLKYIPQSTPAEKVSVIDAKDCFGWTALMWAAKRNKVDCAISLIKAGASISSGKSFDKDTIRKFLMAENTKLDLHGTEKTLEQIDQTAENFADQEFRTIKTYSGETFSLKPAIQAAIQERFK